ncbi:MAG: cation diffusion facilitator family transporter, partial [Actinomycetota bacterium]
MKKKKDHHHHHPHAKRHHHGLGGHHTAHHSPANDGVLETSQQGIQALKISLAALAATGGIQLLIFSATASVSLLADLIHNLADALTALPLWVAFRVGRRPSNRRYTYGYGRAEDIAGIFIIAVIAFSAAAAGWESVRRLFDPQTMRHPGWVMAAA